MAQKANLACKDLSGREVFKATVAHLVPKDNVVNLEFKVLLAQEDLSDHVDSQALLAVRVLMVSKVTQLDDNYIYND